MVPFFMEVRMLIFFGILLGLCALFFLIGIITFAGDGEIGRTAVCLFLVGFCGLMSYECFKSYKSEPIETNPKITLEAQIAELKSELDFIKNKPKYEKLCKEYGMYLNTDMVYHRSDPKDDSPNHCTPNKEYENYSEKHEASTHLYEVVDELKIMRKVKKLPTK